jgi:uroporphyrinogen decarboxylase
MRQAGRYMEEYRSLRARHTFLEMCTTPELAAQVTLQPVRRFDLDAAIIFSDILLPLQAMGVGLAFHDAGGPAIARPVRSPADVSALGEADPEEAIAPTLAAIEMVRRELSGIVPLIGFCGGPFTLAAYLVEGGGSKNFLLTKTFMYCEPEAFGLLMDRLSRMAAACLNAQIARGAQAVQVFDTWAGVLSADDYRRFVLGHMKRLFASLDRSVPSIHFGVGACHLLPLLRQAGGDVMGVDWRLPIDEAWDMAGRDRAVQGNLDPAALFAPPERLEAEVRSILDRTAGANGHIFNLGHGILPGTPAARDEHRPRLVHNYRSTECPAWYSSSTSAARGHRTTCPSS